MTSKTTDELDDDDESSVEAFEIFKTPRINHLYEVYLSSNVESAEDYIQLRHKLQKMGPKDTVNVHLANYGGLCHGLTSLVSAISRCKATITMIVDAPCYSAGSTLALVGDALIMADHSFLMFHNYSAGAHGKGNELHMQVEESKRWIHTYFRKLHRPFLTTAECNLLEKDQDVYVHWDDKDLQKRIERHFR